MQGTGVSYYIPEHKDFIHGKGDGGEKILEMVRPFCGTALLLQDLIHQDQ